jgi:serine protease
MNSCPRKILLLGNLLLLTQFAAFGQLLDHVQGEVLVQLEKGTDIDLFVADLKEFNSQQSIFEFKKPISWHAAIHLFSFNDQIINEHQLLDHLRKDDRVILAQFNHFVELRTTIPDDPLFDQQWALLNPGLLSNSIQDADIDADLAWDFTTGGLTADGDTIVVAVIDDGTDINHPDLAGNLWYNHAEIPNNGIDDDDNGYIDDYKGWNVTAEMDVIQYGTHGTAVEGVLGAVGNNNLGISGVAWDIKMMTIAGSSNTEAEILEGMYYAMSFRQRYNATNGQEGAFVVALNTSWGIDGGNPEDAPLWCGVYDSLGYHGILSSAATANEDWNVDEVGDLPTTCPSDFLIAVTATGPDDQRTFSAYGPINIDLGAPGEQILTTQHGGDYDYESGTSFAAPQLAGLIALMYTAPCDHLPVLAKADPKAAACLVRDFILFGVDPVSSLENETLSGGRLNNRNSLQVLMESCGDCPTPAALGTTVIGSASAWLHWVDMTEVSSTKLQWRSVGSDNWITLDDVSSPTYLGNLESCTNYEFRVKSYCDGNQSSFSDIHTFITDGCCLPPQAIQIEEAELTAVYINWTPVTAANGYLIRYKPVNSVSWETVPVAGSEYQLTDLLPCTEYIAQVRTVCDGTSTVFSPPVEFATSGCGSCLDHDYCSSAGMNSDFEWIESIQIGDLNNESGPNNGYGSFTGLPAYFFKGGIYAYLLNPGFAFVPFSETFKVWIDLNQDGDFDDPGELVIHTAPSADPAEGSMSIPAFCMAGITRMRISMSWEGEQVEAPCGSFEFGEVEDYCIHILESGLPGICELIPVPGTGIITENTAELHWEPIPTAQKYQIRYREIGPTSFWSEQEAAEAAFFLEDIHPCLNYEYQVRQICMSDTSDYSPSLFFETPCLNTTVLNTDQVEESDLVIFPNPFQDRIFVQGLSGQRVLLRFTDLRGQILDQQEIAMAPSKLTYAPPPDLPSGVYLLEVRVDQQWKVYRLVRS